MEEQPVVTLMSSLQVEDGEESGCGEAVVEHGFCAICLERILIQETALVKGCEHTYCCYCPATSPEINTLLTPGTQNGFELLNLSTMTEDEWVRPEEILTCILRWATYSKNPSCPQCKHPFESLNVHRSLDGCIHDYMFEESVCLLLRASWFVPLALPDKAEALEEPDEFCQYEDDDDDDVDDDDDDLDEAYYMSNPASIRIGNRRWGDNGYVRAGRKEARPINRQFLDDPSAGSSRGSKKKEIAKDVTGRRAKRALKREAADKAAAVKHQQHLQMVGRGL